MVMRVSKDRIDMDDKTLQKPVFKDYGESVVTANSSTSYTINLTLGNVFDITLTGNCALTFSNPSASGTACSFTLYLTQDATGSRTVTWPSAVSWLGASTPTLYTTADSINVFTFLTINGGATWFGASAGGENAVPPEVYLSYGYFGGGYFLFSRYSTVDRIDYSNDTATASTKGPLSLVRDYVSSTGNSSYGYFGGGYAPGYRSTVDRLDYSNDTATATAKGPLTSSRMAVGAVGTQSYGYFGGGLAPAQVSTVDRIDYSNDTATSSAKGPLSSVRAYMAAAGNSSYGYFGGGGSNTTIVDRTDYSNDTATAVSKGPLTQGRVYLAAFSNSSYGYFSGGAVSGFPNSPVSTVDRIDYSNDTATTVAKGPLSSNRIDVAGAGNASYGYVGGTITAVNRVDYSNDTATASSKAPLSNTRSRMGGLQNSPL